MFTGLVQAVGRVASTDAGPRGVRLVIDPQGWDHRPAPGDSLAVSGVCLTLAEAVSADGHWCFDVIPETLAKTTLGALPPGDAVNLEHAATPMTLLGGHVVQGHVDGVGKVESVVTQGEWRVRIRPPTDLLPYLVPKGSICMDGVSLTIAALEPHAWFEVALIPVTLAKTTLGSLGAEARVNLEADAMAKTIVHYLKHFGGMK